MICASCGRQLKGHKTTNAEGHLKVCDPALYTSFLASKTQERASLFNRFFQGFLTRPQH